MVLIGIDPHKATHTAVVVDESEHELARIKVKDSCTVASSSACSLSPMSRWALGITRSRNVK